MTRDLERLTAGRHFICDQHRNQYPPRIFPLQRKRKALRMVEALNGQDEDRMKTKLFFFAIAIAILGSVSPAFAIIGGQDLGGHLPQVQAMKVDAGACTATLVGPRVIVTAAHCCVISKKVTFDNIIGTGELDPSYVYDTSCEATNLPHDFAFPHDLCLVLLDQAVSSLNPISIDAAIPSTGETVTITGTGEGSHYPRQFGSMVVEKLSAIGATLMNPSQQIATSLDDSGAPVFSKAASGEVTLLGVVSVGDGNQSFCGLPPFRTGIELTGSDDGLSFFRNFAANMTSKFVGSTQRATPFRGSRL